VELPHAADDRPPVSATGYQVVPHDRGPTPSTPRNTGPPTHGQTFIGAVVAALLTNIGCCRWRYGCRRSGAAFPVTDGRDQ
jgi:hypothetical protein